MSTCALLIPALRQYQHNDCSGLLAGFDYEETQKVVIGLSERISLLESQVSAMTMLLENVTATEFEGIQCKDIAFTGNWFDARDEIINQ